MYNNPMQPRWQRLLGFGLMPVMPMRQLIPNALTALALCAGLTGMRLALAGNWERAVLAIMLASVLDGIDGRVARYLKGTSRFGAELDSLSDVVAFGVAPAIMLYQWSLREWHGVGWIIALAHPVCCALRLARFNSHIDNADHPHRRLGYNTGIPAPAAAGMALTPMMLFLWLDYAPLARPWCVAPVSILVSLLMVSNLATFTWKAIRVRPRYRLLALLGIALYGCFVIIEPFAAVALFATSYGASIIISQRNFLRRMAAIKLQEVAPVQTSRPADHAPEESGSRPAPPSDH